MKNAFYLSLTLLCLSLTLLVGFHLGNRSAQAQGMGSVVGIESATGNGGNFWAITDTGDVYHVDPCCPFNAWWIGNVLTGSGAATDTQPSTWGQMKRKYLEGN